MTLHVHVSEFWQGMIETAAWVVALSWCLKTYDAIQHLPEVEDLRGVEWDVWPERMPGLTVVVPAKDEAENIAATLEALLLADYPALRIVAVDDRSTDGTGEIMEEFGRRAPERVTVLHVTELPEGWLGKTFALSLATEVTRGEGESEYLLYTDGDVLFSPSILRRSVAYAEASDADHLVVLPTMQVKATGEGIVLGFFQIFGLWASRPWRVSDPKAKRDIVGVGAFNLVRREALEELGGWAPQRLAVLEDITLGRRVKAARLRQRIAFAPGFVLVHWAKGGRGLMKVMTKNLFSAFNFRVSLLLGACGWIGVFCVAPLVGLAWWGTVLPSLLVLCCIGASYRVMGEVSEIDARYGWLYPLGAVAFVGAMLRSMVVVMWQGGVMWRGTLYELRELRQHNSPFAWEREAGTVRDAQLEAKRLVRRKQRVEGKE